MGKFRLLLLLLLLALAGPVLFGPASAKSDWVEDESPGIVQGATGNTQGPGTIKVDKSSGGITLQMGVSHADQLKPIPFKLQIGEIFDERILRAPTRYNWYRIPEWLAGKWKREQESIVSSHDFSTGYTQRMNKSIQSQQVADWGVQRDAKGEIWNCNLSMKGMSNRGSYKSVALVREQMPVKWDKQNHRIVFKEQFVVLHVMHETNAIMDSYIVESLTQYRPIKRGLLETMMSVKIYNADGTPKMRQENRAFDRMVTPYSSVDKYKGVDVRADFERFLSENNLGDLIKE